MKCPDCGVEIKGKVFALTGYEYFTCKKCGTGIRIIHGNKKYAKSH